MLKNKSFSSYTWEGCDVLHIKQFSPLRQGHALIKPLDFHLKSGESLHISGKNGIGKSSVLKGLLGLLPIQGSISRAAHVRCAYLSHQQGLHPDLTVYEYLETHPARYVISHSAIDDSLTQWDLDIALWDQPIRTLSQGQKTRVALAGLSLTQAQLWLLDEPFAALDTQAMHHVCMQLQALMRQGDCHGDCLSYPFYICANVS